MPSLPFPRLDDRSYEDLRRELMRRIPVHAPEWTDHNASDPGVALVELFAWLTENTLQRLNRVPEKARREFLNLLNVTRRPASPATAMARFSLPKGSLAPQVVSFGPGQPRALVAAGPIEFQVQDELEVLPVEARAYVKEPGPEIGTFDDGDEVASLIRDHLEVGAGDTDVTTYKTVPLPDPVDGELPDATALGAQVDSALWIALLVPEDLARTTTPAQARAALAGRVLSVGVRVDDALCGANDHLRCPDPGSPATRYAIEWDVATGAFKGDVARVDTARYDALGVESDGTEGLSRSGVVRVRLPGDDAAFGTWSGDDFEDPDEPGSGADLLGSGALPPLLPDEDVEARVITWIRVSRTEEPHPTVRWVDVNIVEVEQAVTAQPELLGHGTATPGQTVTLAHAPVLADTLLLEVREPSGWVGWQRVPDLGLSRPDDPHYLLDPSTGEIRFGDGLHGRMPRRGELIRARSYRYGGGVDGNVAGGAITKVARSPAGTSGLKVDNPIAASGGRDGETIEEARVRIPQVLRHRERAVAASDFRDLALETPGPAVGRVEVLPRHMPHERVDEVPGVVTLVVLPAYDAVHPDEPSPDREMLRRVCEHLEPRRLVTTELYVTPPEYVPVWISVAVEPDEGYGTQTVRRWVELAVRQHLAPLPPYGPSGKGWPFGLSVREAEVEAAVLRVQGVRLVNQVLVSGTEIDERGDSSDVTGTIAMRAWQLPVVKGVQVVVGDAAEPIDRDDDAPPSGAPVVPVPVEEEHC